MNIYRIKKLKKQIRSVFVLKIFMNYCLILHFFYLIRSYCTEWGICEATSFTRLDNIRII